MDSKYDEAMVKHALDVLSGTGGNVSKASKLTGIPRSVLTSWRDGTRRAAVTAADTPPVTQPEVTRPKGRSRTEVLTEKWDRSTRRSLDIVNRQLERLEVKVKRGEKVTTDDVRGLKDTTWAAAVGTDKLQVLSGGATERRDVRISLVAPDGLMRAAARVIEAGSSGVASELVSEEIASMLTVRMPLALPAGGSEDAA